jgi:FkbM family methyltransferase
MPEGIVRRTARVPAVRRVYQRFVRFYPREMLVEVESTPMYVLPRDSALSRELLMFGVYERGEVRIFHQMVKLGMTVLDLGANIGYFTLLAAKLVGPTGRVFAFEPDPTNFSLLQKNVSMNGYENVTVVDKAVSDQGGRAELFLSSDSWGHSLFSVHRNAGSVQVQVTSIDEFLSKDVMVDFVKMDVEGAELRALRGMRRILSNGTVKAMVIEFHFDELEEGCSSFKEIWDELRSVGFAFYEMLPDRIGEVDFRKALHLADQIGGGVNLLCLRRTSVDNEG